MALAGTEEAEILGRLQERVEKAITLIQELRRERDSWKTRAEAAEAQVTEQGSSAEKFAALEDDCDRMKKERGEVRNRIESILSNLESLDV
jgi:FtsZ-binding cell division protein ZapB